MSWQLTITMREGKDHVLNFETEDEAKAALAEVHTALGLHPRQQHQGQTIAGRVALKPADIRSAEIAEWSPGIA